MARIEWNGDAVAAKMRAASVRAVEHTIAEAVSDARANHPDYPPASQPYERYANRTAFETNAIVSHGAHETDEGVTGTWGAYTNYSLFLEIGTSVEGPTATERMIEGAGDMDAVPPPIGPLMAPRPYLRPAADKEYPLLVERIALAFADEEMI